MIDPLFEEIMKEAHIKWVEIGNSKELDDWLLKALQLVRNETLEEVKNKGPKEVAPLGPNTHNGGYNACLNAYHAIIESMKIKP